MWKWIGAGGSKGLQPQFAQQNFSSPFGPLNRLEEPFHGSVLDNDPTRPVVRIHLAEIGSIYRLLEHT